MQPTDAISSGSSAHGYVKLEARRATADLAHEAITQGGAGPVTIKIRNHGSPGQITVTWSVEEEVVEPLEE